MLRNHNSQDWYVIKEVSSILINGQPVHFVEELKYLGWHMNE